MVKGPEALRRLDRSMRDIRDEERAVTPFLRRCICENCAVAGGGKRAVFKSR